MRVLVCGGRDYNNRELVFRALNELHRRFEIECIIHGGASGADRLAKDWASAAHVYSKEYTADWKRFGAFAGPRRNERMLSHAKPNLVVAFPGGRGTADMVHRAKLTGIDIIEVDRWGETAWYTKRISPWD